MYRCVMAVGLSISLRPCFQMQNAVGMRWPAFVFLGYHAVGLPAKIHLWNFAKIYLVLWRDFKYFIRRYRENHCCNGMVFNKIRLCVQFSGLFSFWCGEQVYELVDVGDTFIAHLRSQNYLNEHNKLNGAKLNGDFWLDLFFFFIFCSLVGGNIKICLLFPMVFLFKKKYCGTTGNSMNK